MLHPKVHWKNWFTSYKRYESISGFDPKIISRTPNGVAIQTIITLFLYMLPSFVKKKIARMVLHCGTVYSLTNENLGEVCLNSGSLAIHLYWIMLFNVNKEIFNIWWLYSLIQKISKKQPQLISSDMVTLHYIPKSNQLVNWLLPNNGLTTPSSFQSIQEIKMNMKVDSFDANGLLLKMK